MKAIKDAGFESLLPELQKFIEKGEEEADQSESMEDQSVASTTKDKRRADAEKDGNENENDGIVTSKHKME